MKNKIFISGVLTLCLSLFAEENATQNEEIVNFDDIQKVANTTKPPKENIKDLVQKAKDRLLGKNPNAHVYDAIVGVDAKADDPQYFDYLTSAYNQAVLELKAKTILAKAGKLSIEEAYKFYHSNVPNPMTEEKLKEQIKAKLRSGNGEVDTNSLLSMAGSILDKAFANSSRPVDDPKLKAKAVEKIFSKSFAEGFVKQGFDDISGLVPYENFIVTDEKGEVKLAVLAYTTKRSIQLARDLKHGYQSAKTQNKDNCKSASEITQKLSKKELLGKFGLKYFYNENCRPALLAYGLDSFIKEDGLNADLQNESSTRATAMADKFISNFLNSNVNAYIKDQKVMSKTKQIILEGIKDSNGISFTNPKSSKKNNVIKEMSKEFSSTSNMNLIGLKTIREWSEDFGDYEVVGAIRYYSMDSIEKANKEFFPKENKNTAPNKSTKKVQHSNNLDVDDF